MKSRPLRLCRPDFSPRPKIASSWRQRRRTVNASFSVAYAQYRPSVVLRGLDHRRAVGAMHVDPERFQPQRDGQRRGDHPHPFGSRSTRNSAGVAERVDADREGGGLVEDAAAADLDPDHIGADHVDPQLFAVQLGERPLLRSRPTSSTRFVAEVVVGLDHAAPRRCGGDGLEVDDERAVVGQRQRRRASWR